MKQFQYRFVESIGRVPIGRDSLIRALNEYGAEGWEVVVFDYGGVILKREITDEVREITQAEGTRRAKMNAHLRHQHDHHVSIGDVFEVHKVRYPDCEWSVT